MNRRELLAGATATTTTFALPRQTAPRPDGWFKGHWGIMVHWILPGPQPFVGSRERDINKAAMGFDVPNFINQVTTSGARWIIFPLGQNTGYYSSPNSELEALAGRGHASARDLVYELAHSANAAGLRFICYAPAELANSQPLQAAFSWGISRDEFETRYTRFLGEYAERLGSLCDGWWLDGCYDHLWLSNKDRNWRLWDQALRRGNPDRLVAYNNGSFRHGIPRSLTPTQDFLAGECNELTATGVSLGTDTNPMGHLPFSALRKDIVGCTGHILYPLDDFGDWVHTTPGPIGPPRLSRGTFEAIKRQARKVGFALTVNVGIYQGGVISPETVSFLRG
jgi:hypothetical protein